MNIDENGNGFGYSAHQFFRGDNHRRFGMLKTGLNLFVGKIGQQRYGNSAHRNNRKISDAPMRNTVAIDCHLIAVINTETIQNLLQLLDLLIGFIV